MEKIWVDYDKDMNGILDKDECRKFVKQTLLMMSEQGDMDDFSEETFEEVFKELDDNKDGQIDKEEMKNFIEKVIDGLFQQ